MPETTHRERRAPKKPAERPAVERTAYVALGAVDASIEKMRDARKAGRDRARRFRKDLEGLETRGQKVTRRLRKRIERKPRAKAPSATGSRPKSESHAA